MPPEKCSLPRWYNSAYPTIYEALVKLVPKFPPNLHLLPAYQTDFTMFESGEFVDLLLGLFVWLRIVPLSAEVKCFQILFG